MNTTSPFAVVRFLFCGILFFANTCNHVHAEASTPRLNNILPRGVVRGGEHKLRFSGARLANAQEIFLYDQGVTVTKIEQIDGNNLDVTVQVADDCRVGEHVAQVRTANGISDYRSFFVGRFSEVAEAEPNNGIPEAQAISLNVTVTGVVTNEDIDYFKISGKKGDRISAEIEALRLGYMFDPAIALLDSNRFEVAVSDDTALTKQDSFFSVILPEDGDYYVTVREASFGGNGESRYRLHVGNFPRPAAVYPAGGPRETEVDLQFIDAYREGQPVRTANQKVMLPAKDGFRGGLFYTDDAGTTPTPFPFRLSDYGNYLEQEPNNSFTEMPAQELPIAFNGVIGEPNDLDYFKFNAKQGQVWHIECFARRIGSGLDPVMHVFGPDKKAISGNDDSRKVDSYIRFQAPADGEYYVRVMDHLRRGQPDFVYRVEIEAPKPELSVAIKRIDRYSQQRQTIAVPQGGRFAVLMDATRKDFGGDIELIQDNLPLGIRMVSRPMPASLNSMPVVFEVDETAELGGKLIDFQAKAKIGETGEVIGHFGNLADFVLGQPNNSLYYGCEVDQLAFAVVEKLPFKLEMVQPQAPLVRNGSLNVKIVAHRDEGFTGPIDLYFPFRPPGVGTTYRVRMPENVSEIDYPLNANGNGAIGNWPVYVIGSGNFKGPAFTATQLADLEVAEPYVTASIERQSIVLGEATQFTAKLNHAKPFEGEAKAEILGIPPNIEIETPQTFTKDTQEIVFNVKTSEKSPVGKHGGMFLQLTIPQNGESMVSRAGNAVLQISKPQPPKKDDIAEAKK